MKLPPNDAAAEPAAPAESTSASGTLPGAEAAFESSGTAYAVAMVELRRLLAQWAKHEPGARLGHDPEELHQLRVTARRIDATLGLFRRQLPPALVRARKTTKAVLRSLGAARDLDVLLGDLAHYCARLPENERAAAEPLRARLESERARARSRMLRGLDSEPTRHWLQTLTRAATERAGPDGGDPALAVMPERVRRRFRKLRKSVDRLRPKSSMEDYHQVRRRAKQLRYATECGAVMFGKSADDMLKALRRLQDRLGAHQDAYMAQSHLASLAADPASGLPPATLFLMGRVAEHQERVAAQARETLPRSWRKVRGKRWKALRARLGELRERAGALTDTSGAAEQPIPGGLSAAGGTSAEQPPEADSHPVKH